MATLKGEEKKKFLHDRLAEVRHNLRKSLTEICAGDLHEGIRIATAVRVLVHETGRQKPLLRQLTPNYLQLEILDEPPRKKEPLPPGVQSVTVMSVPIGFKISKDGVFLDPSLHSHAPTILGRWWTRPSLIHSRRHRP